MRYGSLPRSLAGRLPVGPIEPNHRPDGLTEADVDALAAEAGVDLDPPTDDEPAGTVIHLWPVDQYPGDEAA